MSKHRRHHPSGSIHSGDAPSTVVNAYRDEDEFVLKRWRRLVGNFLCAVLFPMVHENTFGKKIVIFQFAVEFLLNISFCFQNVFPWPSFLAYLLE